MSLLLGRASYIQDFDIDVRYATSSSDPAIRPWDDSFIYMIELARVEGQVYNRLYSAAALKATSSERTEHINNLETALQQCQKHRLEVIDDI